MAFQNQKDSILKFYENTNDLIKQHKEIYDKLVKKLNKKESVSHTLTNNLDDFTEYAFPEFNKFRQSIQEQPLEDNVIDYVYDINKNEYVSNFELPDKKIVIKQHFNLVKVGFISGDNFTNSQGHMLTNKNYNYDIKPHTKKESFKFKHNINGKNFEFNNNIRKTCSCQQMCNCGIYLNQYGYKGYEPNEKINLEFWVDDYFNIYLPKLKTYLVFNYSKFPLCAFYTNMDKMNIVHNYIENSVRTIYYNEHCPDDLKEYDSIKSFIEPMDNYLSSLDKRNEYKGLFCKCLEFFNYKEKSEFFSQYKLFSEKLEQLAPSKSFKKVEECDEDTMNDEKKIFSQSVRIKELDIENSKYLEELEYLRNERKTFIQKEQDTNSKITNFQKLLEELNTQLHDNIDKCSMQQKEILGLKCKNLEYSEIINKCRRFEDEIEVLQNKIIECSSEINKYKTLNNTLIDKQTEFNQKLLQERNSNKEDKEKIKELNIALETNRVKINQLETVIEKEASHNEMNKKKMEELFSNVSKSDNSSDNTYQELLLQQIKDKNLEIDKMKKVIREKASNINQIKQQFNTLKSKLSGLVN